MTLASGDITSYRADIDKLDSLDKVELYTPDQLHQAILCHVNNDRDGDNVIFVSFWTSDQRLQYINWIELEGYIINCE